MCSTLRSGSAVDWALVLRVAVRGVYEGVGRVCECGWASVWEWDGACEGSILGRAVAILPGVYSRCSGSKLPWEKNAIFWVGASWSKNAKISPRGINVLIQPY